mmetsp:Transcript_3376/g.8446  ORF Transcript_3376/g.8446 Transcript_3376/m.8446 type:complete len:240 (-) Transcript_3376:433-1152(-)
MASDVDARLRVELVEPLHFRGDATAHAEPRLEEAAVHLAPLALGEHRPLRELQVVDPVLQVGRAAEGHDDLAGAEPHEGVHLRRGVGERLRGEGGVGRHALGARPRGDRIQVAVRRAGEVRELQRSARVVCGESAGGRGWLARGAVGGEGGGLLPAMDGGAKHAQRAEQRSVAAHGAPESEQLREEEGGEGRGSGRGCSCEGGTGERARQAHGPTDGRGLLEGVRAHRDTRTRSGGSWW